MTLPEHTTTYPQGKSVLLTLLYNIKIISNYIKHLIKSYLKQYLPIKVSQSKLSLNNDAIKIQIRPKMELERYIEL